jgi:hypothetical protein
MSQYTYFIANHAFNFTTAKEFLNKFSLCMGGELIYLPKSEEKIIPPHPEIEELINKEGREYWKSLTELANKGGTTSGTIYCISDDDPDIEFEHDGYIEVQDIYVGRQCFEKFYDYRWYSFLKFFFCTEEYAQQQHIYFEEGELEEPFDFYSDLTYNERKDLYQTVLNWGGDMAIYYSDYLVDFHENALTKGFSIQQIIDYAIQTGYTILKMGEKLTEKELMAIDKILVVDTFDDFKGKIERMRNYYFQRFPDELKEEEWQL